MSLNRDNPQQVLTRF